MIRDPAVLELLFILFLATPIGVLAYMLWLFWTRGRDPERESITVQYEPPDSLTPGECGTLVDDAVALRNITATITDLSVKGYLAIHQENAGESPGDHKGFIFHLTKPQSDWNNLRAHEREVLKSIFMTTNPLLMLSDAMAQLQNAAGNPGLSSAVSRVQEMAKEASDVYCAMSGVGDGPRVSVSLPELQNQFSLHLATIRSAIFDRLVADGYYQRRPDRMRQAYAVEGVFLGGLMAVIGTVLAAATGLPSVPLISAGLLSGAIVIGFGWFLPARTTSGARTLAKVLGFREFLGRVEKDHIERLEKTPELFEKFLPYAMALGSEKKWTHAFADISVPPPKWYKGGVGGGFLPVHLVNDLDRMSNEAGGVFTASPPSSGDTSNGTDSKPR